MSFVPAPSDMLDVPVRTCAADRKLRASAHRVYTPLASLLENDRHERRVCEAVPCPCYAVSTREFRRMKTEILTGFKLHPIDFRKKT